MQEEVENRTIMLAINTTKLTTRELKKAILKALDMMKKRREQTRAEVRNQAQQKAWNKTQSKIQNKAQSKTSMVPQGKQTVKQLVGQNQGVSNIEVTEKNIKSFERVARKYGVDFAVKKDKSLSPPRYLVFFKGRDADAITSAFKEFTSKKLKKQSRESVLKKLNHFKELVKNTVVNRTRKKEREL